MTDGPLAFSPTNKEQRGTVAPGGIWLVVRPSRNGVRLTIAAAERRGPLVGALITAEGGVVDYVRRRDSFTTLPTMKTMLAGRSAKRRIRYGYQCVPKGTYTRTL